MTLWLGLGLIAACQVLLLLDVNRRGGIVIPSPTPLPRPNGALEHVARWVAVNMTGLGWIGYLLVFDGLLTRLSRTRRDPTIASIRARPNRFVVAWLTSIPVWCFFDWVNFYFMDAWRYHGLPPQFSQRVVGYFIAFAAISPGMFLAAQLYQRLGLSRLCTRSDSANRRAAWTIVLAVNLILAGAVLLLEPKLDAAAGQRLPMWASAGLLVVPGTAALILTHSVMVGSVAFGIGFTLWAVLARDPLGNLTLWVGLIFLLDPLNHYLGGPSILADWRKGRWGRWLALMAAGATCGLCWEFWNYWALAKWTYDLPFIGGLEHYKYFEMPWIGFLGFLPFAVECWVVLNTIVLGLERLGLRVAEPLPNDQAVI